MAEPRVPVPALLVVAAFSRHESARPAWARESLQKLFGPLAGMGQPLLNSIIPSITIRKWAQGKLKQLKAGI